MSAHVSCGSSDEHVFGGVQNLLGISVWKRTGNSSMPPAALIRPNESVIVKLVSSGLASEVYVKLCQPS